MNARRLVVRRGLALAAGLFVLPSLASAQQPVLGAERQPRPLSLEQAIELALPASEAVGIARADVLRARGEVRRARADLLPQLTGTASYTRTIESQFNTGRSGAADTGLVRSCDRFTAHPTLPIAERVDSLEASLACLSRLDPFAAIGNLPFGRKNQYSFGLQFSQTLLSGAMIKGRPRAAVAGRRIAELGVGIAEAAARLEITEAYYDAVLADRLLAIAQATLDQADRTLEQTRVGRRVGTAPEFDLLRAQVNRDNQHAAVIQRRSARDLAYLRLRQLLALPLDEPLELTTALDQVPPDSLAIAAEDTAAAGRAAVRQAEAAVTVQDVLTAVTRAERWPTVALTSRFAQVAYPAAGLPGRRDFLTDWTVGVSLTLPLWTSGRIGGNIMVQEAALTQARLRLSQARKGAALEASQAAQQLASALAAWTATQGTVEQAQRAYRIAEIRYQEGISTQTELADARLLLQQAEVNRAVAARDVAVARTRIGLLRDLPLAGADVGATLSSAQGGQQALSGQPAAAPGPAATQGIPGVAP
ncbi:MAG TPA: TolC family protein [Gemmatimonadales bacterium]|jgi:outer membrane protein TolC|nr:TolC family protein [Gemmatimonadales bacterium]